MQQVTIVLRPGLGLDFEAMAPALSLGSPVSIGRGGAVIVAFSRENAVGRLLALDEKLASEGWQQDLSPDLLGLLMSGYEKQKKMKGLLVDSDRLLGEYRAGTNVLEAFISELANTVGEIRRLAELGQKEQAAEHLSAIEVLACAWLESCKSGLSRHEIAKPENVARESLRQDAVNFDLERMQQAVAGPFREVPEDLTRDQICEWLAVPIMAKNAKVRTGEENALVAAAPAEDAQDAQDEQSHAEYRAAQLAGQFDIEVPTSIWKAGYAAGMARTSLAPIGDEHLPLLQCVLDKLMTVGFEAAQQCERHALDEGGRLAEAEDIGGWVLRGFAIAKLKLQPLIEADLFVSAAPASVAPIPQQLNEEHAGSLITRAMDLLGQAIGALGAEREQHADVVDLLTKELDAHRAALGNDHRLQVAAPKMLATLQQVLTKVGGLFAVMDHGQEPSEKMWEEASQAIEPIWDLVAEVEGRDVSDVVEEAIHG